MTGIQFTVPNRYDNMLLKVFDGINLEKFYWKISESEVITKRAQLPLLQESFLCGTEFVKSVEAQEYYVIFLNLQAFYSENEIMDITTLEDFRSGTCQLILLVTDSIFVEIFAKEEETIKKIAKNASHNEFKDIEFITEKNVSRRLFKVL